MHILLIHQAFVTLDEPGGTRHYEFSKCLAQRGHHVTVIASPISYLTGNPTQSKSGDMNFSNGGQITVLRTTTIGSWHRSFLHRVVSFISFMLSSLISGLGVKEVDLVWGTSPPIFQGFTAWLLSWLKRAPLLFEVRDLWPAFAVQIGVLRSKPLISASERLENFLYRKAETVVVNSPGFIEHVTERGARHVVVIPNGTDSTMFDPGETGADFRRVHNLDNKFVALYAGAHGMSNDLDILLEASAELQNQLELTIVLIGDGKEKPALQSKAADLQLNNLLFIEPIPKNEIPQALAASDVCIAILKPIPLYQTVYPNKVFDYMAAGRPVILAIDGVIRSIIEEAQAGIYVQPGDPKALSHAIMTLYNHPGLRRKMGDNARRYVEANFDRIHLAKELAVLVERLSAN